jgi:hypothetical protein
VQISTVTVGSNFGHCKLSICRHKHLEVRGVCGLVVRIAGFHPAGPGSIPGSRILIRLIVSVVASTGVVQNVELFTTHTDSSSNVLRDITWL